MKVHLRDLFVFILCSVATLLLQALRKKLWTIANEKKIFFCIKKTSTFLRYKKKHLRFHRILLYGVCKQLFANYTIYQKY